MSSIHYQFLVCAFAASLLTGCGRQQKNERFVLELQATHLVLKALQIHETQFPERARTNLAQVFEEAGMKYPQDLHRRFGKFNQSSAFTNSFYEKFVLIPPGVTNRPLKAKIAALSSEPFPASDGQSGRAMIIHRGNGVTNWSVDWRSETEVMRFFADARATVPKPGRMPPAPPTMDEKTSSNYSIGERIEIVFRNLAEDLGLGRNHWLTVLGTCALLVSGTAVFVLFFLVRRIRRNN